MKTVYPDLEEMETCIKKAVRTAFPKKRPLKNIFLIFRQIGVKNALADLHYVLAAYAVLIAFAAICGGRTVDFVKPHVVFLIISIASPLMYQTIAGLFLAAEKECGVYETEMTCKYTFFHVLAVRMIFMSVVCAVCNAAVCILLLRETGMQTVLRGVFLSVTSLGIYSVCYFAVVIHSVRIRAQFLLIALWSGFLALIYAFFPKIFRFLMMELPAAFHIVIWVVVSVTAGAELAKCFWREKTRIYHIQ